MGRTKVVLIMRVFLENLRQELNLRLCLHEKGLLGLDDLDSDLTLGLNVLCADDLAKGSLADPFHHLVPAEKDLSRRHNVVVVLVIPSVIVGPLTFGCLFLLPRCTSGISFLVVNSVDSLVSVNERHRQLDERSVGREAPCSRLYVRLLKRLLIECSRSC